MSDKEERQEKIAREGAELLGSPTGVPSEIAHIDEMKAWIVDKLVSCGVSFPIENKAQFLDIFPFGTPLKCVYNGKETHIHDIIRDLNDNDFPIKTAGDAATVLIGKCEVPIK
jgi:hypothetical protein